VALTFMVICYRVVTYLDAAPADTEQPS
jgi:hypothetical protein